MDIKVFFASMSVPVVVLLIAIILAAFNIYEIHRAEISMKRMRRLLDEMIVRHEK